MELEIKFCPPSTKRGVQRPGESENMQYSEGFMALVENIYFSVTTFANGQVYNEYFNKKLGVRLEEFKHLFLSKFEDFVTEGVKYSGTGIQRYPYGFNFFVYSESDNPDFRVYFSQKVGDNYPFYVIVSAEFLHISGLSVNDVMDLIKAKLLSFLFFLTGDSFNVVDFKLSRIDICNHTVKINLDRYIDIKSFNSRVVTRLKKVFPVIELVGQYDQKLDYYRYGQNAFVVRFYNKIKEVVQMRYKQFFIPRWYEAGLIDEKTYMVYDFVYKLNRDFETDFIYSHLILYGSEELKEEAMQIYYDVKIENAEKYEIFKEMLKSQRIRLVSLVVNVEFQLRNEFLKTVRIIDNNTGELIDFTDVEQLFNHLEVLYRSITVDNFRVVNSKKSDGTWYKRKRKAPIDPIWAQLIRSKIVNLTNFETDSTFLRKYRRDTNLQDTINKMMKNSAYIIYQSLDKVTYSDVENISLDEINSIILDEAVSENHIKIKEYLMKQIRNRGEKY